jgi:hypothetical protein
MMTWRLPLTQAKREEVWRYMLKPKDCFVCKMPLIEWKCMTPTCPKYKDPYTLSREELLEKTTAIKNYDPSKPGVGKADPVDHTYDEFRYTQPAVLDHEMLRKWYAEPIKSDGGPSTYFDLCNGGTLNDELERKGDEQWLGDSFHLGNVVKLAWRWGIKEGTDKAYDANKLIYSGARLLMKYKGVAAVRKSLQKLLDDPQFQERDKDK